ncbi:MAG: hypothetical protein WA865_10805 [Spirulinaceae cyanobacterium]
MELTYLVSVTLYFLLPFAYFDLQVHTANLMTKNLLKSFSIYGLFGTNVSVGNKQGKKSTPHLEDCAELTKRYLRKAKRN